MSKIINGIIKKAIAKKKHIVLPEGFDKRMVAAAETMTKKGIATVTLLGNEDEINQIAADEKISLDGVNLIDPKNSEWTEEFTKIFYNKRKHKGITEKDAETFVKQHLYFGNLMLLAGKADGCVAGAFNTTGDVIRAALQVVGVKKGTKLVSSTFMMIMPDEKTYFFSDCALVPDPNAEELASIAISTAETFKALRDETPNIAMLSFSTKGSGGKNPGVLKVVEATNIVRELAPDLNVDGELQLDTAIIDSIGKKKAPNSNVAGNANVLIFPDLNSGNIGYKLTQRLAGAEAVGPFVQGLALPSFDLSRGCSEEDIVNTAAVCCLLA